MNNFTTLSKISSFCMIFLFSLGSLWAQCDAPTVISIDQITQISASADFDSSANDAISYEIEVRTAGMPGTGGVGLVQSGTASFQNTFFNITGLSPNTSYTFYVRSVCAGPIAGDWSVGTTFETLVLAAPVAVAADEVEAISFIAKWETVFGATEYLVTYSSDNFITSDTEGPVSSLSVLVFNLTPLTQYKYMVQARVGNGPWSGFSNEISVTTTDIEGLVARWTSTGWLQQPTVAKELKFEANFNTAVDQFGTSLEGKKMTIDSGVTVTIAPDTYIQVEENVVNSGIFIIESNGNFNQRSSIANVGNAVVKRNSFPIYRLDYTMWSSPVSGQLLQAFSPLTVASRFYSYNSSTDQFNQIPNVATTPFIAGEGYLIRSPNNWIPNNGVDEAQSFPGQFSGELNTGTINVSLDEGYNMVGNPYPCDINAYNLLEDNTTIDGTLYFWRRQNNDITPTEPTTSYYATFTEAGGVGIFFVDINEPTYENTRPDGTIKVGQGFLVNTKEVVDGNIQFEKEMKVANAGGVFLKNSSKATTEVERHKFYLGLTGGVGISSEILLAYTSNGSDNLDRSDAKYIGDSPIALTSIIDNDSYVIQAKALPFQNTSEFALRFQTSVAANYTISLGDVTGMFTEDVDPILIDMLTNTETNLRNSSYTFASEIGIFDTRFKIVFIENYLSNNDVVANANAVVVMSKDNILSINAGTYTINGIEIFDMLGRKIYSKSNIDASATSISDLRAQNQIILVQIATDHGVVTKKVQF